MTGFTHYSLFEGHTTLRDFAALPTGGLPELLGELHALTCPAATPRHCVGITHGTLHPDGEQMSFGVGLSSRGEPKYTVILMTRDGVAVHAVELASEGNDSAALARAALAD